MTLDPLTPMLSWEGERFGFEPKRVTLYAIQATHDWWDVILKFRCGGCDRRWGWPEIRVTDIATNAARDDILAEAVKVLIEHANERGYYPGERLACPDCRPSIPEALP